MTNLEKLRSFSAEDLAEFLHNIRFTCYTCGKLNCPNSAFTDEVLKCKTCSIDEHKEWLLKECDESKDMLRSIVENGGK